jgi:hypothetical protein
MNNLVRGMIGATLLLVTSAWGADECPAPCPSGWTDKDGACVKPAPYGRGPGYAWKHGDENNNKGQMARCEAARGGAGSCEMNGVKTYPKCKEGYRNVGCCTCTPICPAGFKDTAKACTKPDCKKP